MQVAETFTFPIPAHDLREETRNHLLQLLPQSFKPHDPSTCITCPSDTQQPDRMASATAPAGHKGTQQHRQEEASYTKGNLIDDKAEVGTDSSNRGSKLLPLAEMHLSDWVRLDTCVTVVDGSVFESNLHSIEELKDRYIISIC